MQPSQGPYQPSQENGYPAGQQAAPQWTQVPVPGQGMGAPQPGGQPMPGQVPPPGPSQLVFFP